MNLNAVLAYAGALLGAGFAIVTILRRPRNAARCAFATGMMLLAVESLFGGLAAASLLPADGLYWLNWRLCVMALLPGTWLLFSLAYARGNAREFLAAWWLPLVAAFAVPVGLLLLAGGRMMEHGGATQLPDTGVLKLSSSGRVLCLLFIVAAILVLMNLERTFRASVGTVRWRIKFMVLGLGLLFVTRAYTGSQMFLFRAINPALEAVEAAALVLACLLIAFSLLRAGYFDVDIYPSRAALHNSLTVLVAGAYLLTVGVLAKVVAYLGGSSAFATEAFLVLVALVLLAVLLLSERIRLHTRRFVSRHFQRPLYDYRSVWRSFTESTSSRVEQADLCRAVVKLVSDYFQVLSVTIWLVDNERENLVFGASTALPEGQGETLKPSVQDAAEVIRGMRQHAGPVDIDSSSETWAAALRRCTPTEFRSGGNRISVPLAAGGEVLGVLILGDRVGGVRFLVQDLDLLKCVGDQAAASLLNIQLAKRLMRAKEMEAFQTMSAFFVHDLKNTASTLSLMLQNLRVHFDNPEFREDALRGVSRTVEHINHLISRLTQLRQEMKIAPVASDLNALVVGTLGHLDAVPDVRVATNLRPLPKLLLDPEQIQKVLTNLVINAREAIGGAGEIRIETLQENSWAVLSVADNGCGMDRDFLERSLFRPFQTTKKKGIGIGMFQSKMIVEAHRGRIEVESEPGKGTTFRVRLPVQTHAHETQAAHS